VLLFSCTPNLVIVPAIYTYAAIFIIPGPVIEELPEQNLNLIDRFLNYQEKYFC